MWVALAAAACTKPHSETNPPEQRDPLEAGEDFNVVVAFCVDGSGHTRDVEVVKSSGNTETDELFVSTVATWRFKPYDITKGRACTTENFEVRFDDNDPASDEIDAAAIDTGAATG